MTGESTPSIVRAQAFLVPLTALWMTPYLLLVLVPSMVLSGFLAYFLFLAGGIALLALNAWIAYGVGADRAWARRGAVVVAYMCLFPALAGFMLVAFNLGLPVASFCLLSALWFGYVAWCLSRSAVGLAATGGVLLAYGLLESIFMVGVQNRRVVVGLGAVVAGVAVLSIVWRLARPPVAAPRTLHRPAR